MCFYCQFVVRKPFYFLSVTPGMAAGSIVLSTKKSVFYHYSIQVKLYCILYSLHTHILMIMLNTLLLQIRCFNLEASGYRLQLHKLNEKCLNTLVVINLEYIEYLLCLTDENSEYLGFFLDAVVLKYP